MENLISSLKSNLFLKQILTLSSGNAISYVFGLIAIPVLARIYGKEAFDVLALYTSVISIGGVTITLLYDQALVRAQTEEDAIRLARWSILSSAIFSSLIFCTGLLTISYFRAKYPWYGWLFVASISLGSLVAAWHQTAMQFMNRMQDYVSMRNVKMGFTAMSLVLQVAFFSSFPLFGMVHGQWSGKLIGSLNMLRKVFKRAFEREQQPRNTQNTGKTWKELAYENINFQRFQLPAVLIDRVSAELPTLLLAVYFASHLADFSVAMRVILIPVSIMSAAYSQVFYRRSSELVHAGQSLRPFLIKTWLLMAGLVVLPVAILYYFGPEIFGLVLGDKWTSAGELASILSLLSAVIFIGASTSTGFQALNKQSVSLVLITIGLIYKLLIFYYGQHYFDFEFTIRLFVGVHSIGIIFNSFILYLKS